MKKRLLSVVLLAMSIAMSAQGNDVKIKFYGFVRNYLCYDTRESLTTLSGQFYVTPSDECLNEKGEDLNKKSSIQLLGISSRFGLDLSGPEFLGAKTSGKIETDFGGFGTNNTVFRIRHAYAKLKWKSSNLLIGQAWHPMTGDLMPDVFSLATGSPFEPFSRSPQVRFDYLVENITFTATALYQFQNLSYGPNNNNLELSTNSYDFARRAIVPELYFQVSYKTGSTLVGGGVDILTLRPRTEYTNPATSVKSLSSENVIGFTPTLFVSHNSSNWGIKVRVTYAQNASHLSMLSGYGVTKEKDDGECEYSPLNSIAGWVNVTYRQKLNKGSLTYCLFGGYMNNLGASKDFVNSSMIYLRGYKNLGYVWRVSPSVVYTQNAMSVGLEYEPTTAGYGTMNADGSVSNTHAVTNHRICAMVKYTF